MTDFHLKLGSLNFVFPSIERRLSNEIVFSNTIPRPVSGRGDDIYCMIVAFYLSDRYVDRQTVFFSSFLCTHGGLPIPLGKLSPNDLFSSLLCDERMVVGSVKKRFRVF